MSVDRQDGVRAKPAVVFAGAERRSPVHPDHPRPLRPRQEELQALLEDSYERHTEQLVKLTAGLATGADSTLTHDSRVSACRRSISAIAAALRDMADGKYDGICESCRESMPVERLRLRPDARCCVSCVVWPRR